MDNIIIETSNSVKPETQSVSADAQSDVQNVVPYHTHNGIDSPKIDLPVNNIQFGGDGSDGDLYGTQTIDLGGASLVIKNYKSINIASGQTIDFSNPHAGGTVIIIKSQGNVVITGTLDASGCGATGGTGGARGGNNGTSGTVANGIVYGDSANGKYGSGLVTKGTAGVIYSSRGIYTVDILSLSRKSIFVTPGSGGGGGGGGNNGVGLGGAGGDGGRGGGALIIECAGGWDFTGTISIAGDNGSTGSNASGTDAGAGGGGGGGAGGWLLGLYKELVNNTGTVVIDGGDGGNGGTNSGASSSASGAGAGSGAGMYAGAGGNGGDGASGGTPGSNGANGSNSATTSSGAGTGGTKGASTYGHGGGGGGATAGEYLITKNYYF